VKPYYADEYVTLYHGDCLEVDAWLDADVLVTDPPYGIGWQQGSNCNKSRNSRPHNGIRNDESTAVRDAALGLWGLHRPSIAFGSFRQPAPAVVRQTLVWKKPIDAGVVGSTTGYRTDVELVYLLGPHAKRPAERSSVLESRCGTRRYNPTQAGNGHPHAKHVAILEQLIEWTDGLVADPFAGSGSTLIAARNLGRKSVGVELEERYCEIIASRLDQQVFDFGDSA
jgi:hypothetical protein